MLRIFLTEQSGHYRVTDMNKDEQFFVAKQDFADALHDFVLACQVEGEDASDVIRELLTEEGVEV